METLGYYDNTTYGVGLGGVVNTFAQSIAAVFWRGTSVELLALTVVHRPACFSAALREVDNAPLPDGAYDFQLRYAVLVRYSRLCLRLLSLTYLIQISTWSVSVAPIKSTFSH